LYRYFDEVVGLGSSKDLEGYDGGSVSTGTASHARQVKGEDEADAMGVGVWVRDRQTHPMKKVYDKKSSKMPQKGLISRRRSVYKEKDLIFRTWNVQTLSKTKSLISSFSHLKQDSLNITALQKKTRWG
jgi:hypothetical protein